MDRQLFLTLTSTAQWALFLSLALLIYSWLEKKTRMQLAALGLFVLLSGYAVWVIQSGLIIVPQTAAGSPAPTEAKVLTFFSGLIVCGSLAALSLLLRLAKLKWAPVPSYLLVPIALGLFFMIYHLQRL